MDSWLSRRMEQAFAAAGLLDFHKNAPPANVSTRTRLPPTSAQAQVQVQTALPPQRRQSARVTAWFLSPFSTRSLLPVSFWDLNILPLFK